MIKQKLISKRLEKKITQEEMAFRLGMSQSQYCRRENGSIRISGKEWNKLASILEITLKEIYESEDGIYMISKNENEPERHNHYHLLPDYVLEAMKKYIEKLESELEIKNSLKE